MQVGADRLYQILAYDDEPFLKGTWAGSRDPFFNFAPIMSLKLVKHDTSNFEC